MLWFRVIFYVHTDVSEERIPSIFKVENLLQDHTKSQSKYK
jgi:hypothetical protein